MGSLKDIHILEKYDDTENKVTRGECYDDLTCVMGPPSHSVQQLLCTLEREPDLITWSAERNTTVWKGACGKLGFKAKSYKGKAETFTVILKVKEECCITAGQLKQFDRITSINNYNITKDSEQHILNILTTLNDTEIALTLCRPVKFKIPKSNCNIESRSRDDHNVEECSMNVSVRSISFNSWNSTGNEGLELPEISTDVSYEQNSDFKETETSFNVIVRSKHSPITNPHETEKGVTKILQEANRNVDNNVDTVLGKDSNISDVNHNVKFIRTSSESKHTVTSSDSQDNTLKRGLSQVSSSDSNKSRSSNPIESTMRRREKSTKAKDHKNTKFVKTGSIENNDEEVEPLHPEESTSPPNVARLAPYRHFNADDRSNSMPTTVSMADIEVEDPTLSLPHGVSNVGMIQSQSTNMCLCSVCLPGSDHKLCSKCAVKTKPGSSNPGTTSVSVLVPFPVEDSRKILEKPQYAVWDGINTHVVEIEKDKSKGFGFSYKVMVGENQDSSVETYTLVNEVDKEGPSKDRLRIGDWVRSVNGTPIQVPQDAYTLLNSTKDATRRLVIQRPIGLSRSQQNLQVERDKAVQDLNPPSPQSPDGAGDQDPLIPGTIAPKKRQDKSIMPSNIYVINSSHVESCSKTVLPPFPKSAKLPKVRIFLCGSEAEKCLHFLLKDSILDIELQNHCYSFISCSMATDCFGNILLSQPCSNLFSASTTSPHPSSHNQSDLRGGGDTKCKQCGGDFVSPVDGHDHGQGHLVNVELFAVPDDRFFHFCCSYLFTKSSIFILTFDGSRMLRSAAGEFLRLQNLSHTVRSMAGEDSHIMSCGFIDDRADTGNIADEVRALFYTPLNSVLQNFQVFGPELVSGNSSSSASDNLDENQLLQTLWKVVTETVQRQQVLQPSLLLIDHMITLREEFVLTESQLMEVIKGKLPNYQMDVHQMILTYLIENREILLGKASSFINTKSHRHMESLILVNPQCLLTCLQRIITTVNEDKQNWIKMQATGFIKTSSFLELCGETDKKQQIMADFMECNGIIVKKPNSANIGVTTEYFFPYFSVTPSTADSERDVVECGKFELYLKFVDNESSQVYFALLFTVAGNVDTPSSFNVQDVQTCVFQHKGYRAFAYHQKIHDRVHFVFKREDKSASACPVDLFSWLKDICHDVLDSLYVSFLLGAPCPRGENCARTTADSIHVIDLREKKPQYCDKERVDTMKPIRKWKQKESQVQETVVSVGSRSSKSCKQPVSVLDLPHTVVHNVCSRLRIPSELGRDWRGLAGLMGYTLEEVRMMETVKDPVRQLLYDWSTTHGGRIDELIKLLEELNLDNVLCYLRQALPQNNLNSLSSPPTPTQNSTVSFQTLSLSQNSESSENSYLTGQVLYQRSKVTDMSKVTETEVMPLHEEGQGQMIRMNNLDGNNQMDMIGSSNQAITPVETVMGFNRILKS